MNLRICLLFSFLLFLLPVFSQEYIPHVQRFGMDEGLPNFGVYSIFKDKEGFVWLGSNGGGLTRFDGYSFKNWTKAKNGLSDDRIQANLQDPEGLLWLYSIDGSILSDITIFNPKTNEIVPFLKKFSKQLPSPTPQLTVFYATDQEGAIYLSTIKPFGILKYHPKTGLQRLNFSDRMPFLPLFCTGHQTIWGYHCVDTTNLLAGRELVECDFNGNIIQNLGYVKPKIHSSISYIPNGNFLYESYQENNIVITYQYIADSPSSKSNLVYSQKRLDVVHSRLAHYIENGHLLYCDNKLIEVKTGKIILDLIEIIPEIASYGITSWLIDQKEQLWIGTIFGLYIISISPKKFNTFLCNENSRIPGIAVGGILPRADNTLVVNTSGFGQWKINPATGSTSKTPADSKLDAYGLCEDRQGNLYYTPYGGEFDQQSSSGKITHHPWKNKESRFIRYDSIHQKLWLCVFREGIYLFDLTTRQLNPYTQYNGFDVLSKATIVFIGKDIKGSIWVCSDKGLFQLDPDKGVIARYWPGGKGQFYLPFEEFEHLCVDKKGLFWLATSTGGMIRWDKNKAEFKVFDQESGLSNNSVYAIYEDDHDQLWLATDNGINQFDKIEERIIRIYGTGEGISHRSFINGSHARGIDGTLYFGSLNGITAFNPNDFYGQNSTNNDPLVLTDCKKYTENSWIPVNITQDVLKNGTITLGADSRYFVLEIALLAFQGNKNDQYAYRFDDDKTWKYQKDRTFHFGGLSYGKHTLYFKARSGNGDMSTSELKLIIYQLKPFYLQAWFLLLFVALLVAGVFLYVRWRTSQIKANQRKLEVKIREATAFIETQSAKLRRMDEVKSRFFANVSHELRTPLTLVLNPITTALKRNRLENHDFTLLKLAQTEGRALLKLINQILDITKLDSDKLEIQEAPVLLFPYLNRIVAAFESQATYLGLNFIFEYKAEKNLQLLLDAPKVETILYNLLSNAMKFTPVQGSVCLEVEDVAHSIRISVSDTGKGIHPDDLPFIFDRFYQSSQPDVPIAGGTGIGLSLCHELVNLMKGEIRAESPYPASGNTGTRIYVTLPRKQIFTDIFMEKVAPPSADTDIDPGSLLAGLIPANEAVDTTRQTILVVEDNSSLRAYLELILSAKFSVKTAENGLQAWEYLTTATPENLPDLLLSDIMMQGMDGFQLLGKLKANDQFSQLPVIMLTARANIQDRLKALRIGVDDYLLKPFEEEELIARIDNLLKNYLARKEANSPTEIRDMAPDTIVAEAPKNTAEEIFWIQTLKTTILENLENNRFNLDLIAEKMGLSHRQLQRRLISATGLTPSDFLTEIRLDQARQLLEDGEYKTVKEVAKAVGYAHQAYFSTLFRIRFGKMPSDYLV